MRELAVDQMSNTKGGNVCGAVKAANAHALGGTAAAFAFGIGGPAGKAIAAYSLVTGAGALACEAV